MLDSSFEQFLCEFCCVPTKNVFSHFYRCPNCGNLFNLNHQTTSYEDSYFEGEYEKQYGKTYIDDKSNIQKRMKLRLEQVRPFIQYAKHKKLLEIGSAAGFFLELASAAGFLAKGWEISKYMSDYANEHGSPTIQGDFLNLLQEESRNEYDMICAFYVIEHFKEQKEIWKGLSRIIRDNGLLILALPSTFGPAFYYHQDNWIKNHPRDHL